MKKKAPKLTVVGPELPEYLACGPCIEDFAEPGHGSPQWSALRRWSRAVDAWGIEAGLTGRDLVNVRNLARTGRAWSRAWFIGDGRQAEADYLNGKRPDRPPSTGWRPRVAPGVVEQGSPAAAGSAP